MGARRFGRFSVGASVARQADALVRVVAPRTRTWAGAAAASGAVVGPVDHLPLGRAGLGFVCVKGVAGFHEGLLGLRAAALCEMSQGVRRMPGINNAC